MSGFVGVPYVVGSDTSEEAAESIVSKAASLRLRILNHVHERNGLGVTCDEIEVLMGLRHQTASARIRELVQQKYLIDSGRRRINRSKREAAVWIIDTSPPTPETEKLATLLKQIGFKHLEAFSAWVLKSKGEGNDIQVLRTLLGSWFQEKLANIDWKAIEAEKEAAQRWREWLKSKGGPGSTRSAAS